MMGDGYAYCYKAHRPHAASYAAGVVHSDELVAGGSAVEVGLLLIHKESVRHPDVLDKLCTHRQRLHTRLLHKRQSRVSPELAKVKIQCKVLKKKPIVLLQWCCNSRDIFSLNQQDFHLQKSKPMDKWLSTYHQQKKRYHIIKIRAY